jgi:hypothetical protein
MERIKNIALCLLVALFLASLLLNVRHYADRRNELQERSVFVDTIPYYKPVPKDSIVIRYVTKRLPTVKDEKTPDKKDSLEKRQATESEDLLCKEEPELLDSADVLIPITQKVYEDSTYRAVISGYNVSLDEMLVFPKREVLTIRSQTKSKRWSVGVQAGYGITPAGFQPYLGVGITCNLFSF